MTKKEALWRKAILPHTATIKDAVKNLNDVAMEVNLTAAFHLFQAFTPDLKAAEY